jgi:hypothetical protein
MRQAPEVTAPALVIDGGDFGNGSMRRAAQGLAATLPRGQDLGLEGQHHRIVPATIGPPLRASFAA